MENGNTGKPGVATHALTTTSAALAFEGTPIRTEGEMVCLTDMWRAAGSDDSKRPARWREQESAGDLTKELEKRGIVLDDNGWFRVVRTGGSAPASTFAHWQLALAYAKYLSPAFHIWCNEVVRAHMESQALERQGFRAVRASTDPNTAHLRALNTSRRLDLEEKKMKERAFSDLAKRLQQAGRADMALVIEVKRAEAISGESLAFALPPAEHHDWKSPTAIAADLGTNANAIGRTISALGIRGDFPGICKPVMNKAHGNDREVTTYVYSPKAIDQIKAHLDSFKKLEGGAE